MDKIIISDLQVHGILGINPDERIKKQHIVVNLTLFTDIRTAAKSKQIDDAVDYSYVAHRVEQHIERANEFLVETLVSDVAELILDEFAAVEKVIVRIEKPNALNMAHNVGVEIERTRDTL